MATAATRRDVPMSVRCLPPERLQSAAVVPLPGPASLPSLWAPSASSACLLPLSAVDSIVSPRFVSVPAKDCALLGATTTTPAFNLSEIKYNLFVYCFAVDNSATSAATATATATVTATATEKISLV